MQRYRRSMWRHRRLLRRRRRSARRYLRLREVSVDIGAEFAAISAIAVLV